MNEISIPVTLNDYCRARDRAINLFAHGAKAILDAKAVLDLDVYLFPHKAEPSLSVNDFAMELDRRLWRYAFKITGLRQVLDAQAKREFDLSLERNPPEFTIENIKEQFLSMQSQADLIFSRGLVNVFRSLSKAHKSNTNEPFKMPDRCVLTRIFQNTWDGGVCISYCAREKLVDMDRVIKTLDGKKHDPGALETAVNATIKQPGDEYEDEYYQIKGFKNGNAHIKFLRSDLLKKANRIIAMYYGNQLASA